MKEFSQTVSKRYSSVKQFSADVAPGAYELLLQVTDLESKKNELIKRSILVKDFGIDTLALSDIMLVQRMSVEGVHRI